MEQKAYVNFEQAKLLKEKGFPQGELYQRLPNYMYFGCNGKKFTDNPKEFIPTKEIYYAAPTLSLVQRWFIKEKNIHIEPCVGQNYPYRNNFVYGYRIYKLRFQEGKNKWDDENDFCNCIVSSHFSGLENLSIDEALSMGIDNALEYI